MADEFEVKISRKKSTQSEVEDAAKKVQAAAKAVKNKGEDAVGDLEREYRKERLKEKLD